MKYRCATSVQGVKMKYTCYTSVQGVRMKHMCATSVQGVRMKDRGVALLLVIAEVRTKCAGCENSTWGGYGQ